MHNCKKIAQLQKQMHNCKNKCTTVIFIYFSCTITFFHAPMIHHPATAIMTKLPPAEPPAIVAWVAQWCHREAWHDIRMPWPWPSLLHCNSQQWWSNVEIKLRPGTSKSRLQPGKSTPILTTPPTLVTQCLESISWSTKPPPPCQVAKLSAFVACSSISGLSGNCKDSEQEQQEQEKKVRSLLG